RRERFEGQILARVLGVTSGDRALERPTGLRDLERALGRWRDVELTRDLWRSVRSPRPGARESRWLGSRERNLDQEAQALERQAVVIAQQLVGTVPRSPPAPAPPTRLRRLETPGRWRRELDARRRRYLRALGEITDALPPEATHAFRQEVRRLGVFYDLLAAAPWAVPPKRTAKIQRVLDRLGQLHDLDRAIGRLAAEPASALRREYRDRLRSERRRAAERARRALAAKGVRRYAERSVRRAP
ncbi:MAG: hypothetical protein L3J73_03030, partial [Thermoplasmata archaeon]|nr:hypothetical protein [Thermoplasmata archaeon]